MKNIFIPIRNLRASKDKSNFENYLGTATEARYEYRGTEPFSNKHKMALPQSGCVSVIPDMCCTSSVATLVAPASSSPSRKRRNSQSLLAIRLRFGIMLIICGLTFASICRADVKNESAKTPVEFKAPAYGAKIELKLEDGRIIKGMFLEIAQEKVYVEAEGPVKLSFDRNEIAANSRWQFFKADYDKKLAEQTLEADRQNKLKTKSIYANDLPKDKLKHKLNTINIPRVDFEDITIADAVKYLREQSKQLDPEGDVINIYLLLPPEKKSEVVDLVLTNKTLGEAIYFLCRAANLKLRIDKYAVVISK